MFSVASVVVTASRSRSKMVKTTARTKSIAEAYQVSFMENKQVDIQSMNEVPVPGHCKFSSTSPLLDIEFI
jgi:hypothetical protein